MLIEKAWKIQTVTEKKTLKNSLKKQSKSFKIHQNMSLKFFKKLDEKFEIWVFSQSLRRCKTFSSNFDELWFFNSKSNAL